MIVRLEVSASEKVALRSQYEPNSYGVLIAVENLELQHPDELKCHAEELFRKAKEAIASAKREDGVDVRVAPLASPKQRDLIQALAKRAGLDEQRLTALAKETVGSSPEQLNRYDASRLIGALEHVGNGRPR